MERFPHLKLERKIIGKPRLFGGGEPSLQTKENLSNRVIHGNVLKSQTDILKIEWLNKINGRTERGHTNLNSNVIPLFLQIDPDVISSDIDLDSFKKYNIEIISESDDGFIIGASTDGFGALNDKIERFLNNEHGGNTVAKLWNIVTGDRWRLEQILSSKLLEKWQDIQDEEVLTVECSIACYIQVMPEPTIGTRSFEKKMTSYRNQRLVRDELFMERQGMVEEYINSYSGELTDSYIDNFDSFSFRMNICMKGLKDLVSTFPYIFEVNEIEEFAGITETNNYNESLTANIVILPPNPSSPIIGLVDSGIQEQHLLLEKAIDSEKSISYLPNDTNTSDYVFGGHGTRVAGAILFPNGVTSYTGEYILPCFIRNLRVLDGNNLMPISLYPPKLINQIVNDNQDIKIFNLSINTKSPFRLKHMSSWSSIIDKLSHEQNLLFIISTGNISFRNIQQHLNSNLSYPEYLLNPINRISNPGQSSFALTVGSINETFFQDSNWKSLGNSFEPSGYTKCGPGIWDMIKPDVVEYGGGIVASLDSLNRIATKEETTSELLRSTLSGGPAIGRDVVGTSYSAPKVTHIVSRLKYLYPNEDNNLLRALIIQGARLPEPYFLNPTRDAMSKMGYGIPSLEKVTKNTAHRITFYNTNNIAAEEGHVYSIKIPDSLKSPGDEYDVLVEVSLAFTAPVRRTRQKTKSYLATWLDWSSSKINESLESFKDFALKEISGTATNYDKEKRRLLGNHHWMLGERDDRGHVEGLRRANSTAQKDWSIIKSYNLGDDLCFVVKGHKGWDKDCKQIPYAFVISIEILGANIEIYNEIRLENEIQLEVEVQSL